jgi:hypothetical protein
VLLDVAGHRRSPATMPGYHRGRPPRNKGEQYPADPPTVEEIVAVMRSVGDRSDGERLRALIVLLCAPCCGSAKRSPSRRVISTEPVAPCSSGVEKGASDEKSAWIVGPGSSLTRGSSFANDSNRVAGVRDSRSHRRPAVGGVGRAKTATSGSPGRGCQGAGSRRISSGMPMRSRWRTRAFHWL